MKEGINVEVGCVGKPFHFECLTQTQAAGYFLFSAHFAEKTFIHECTTVVPILIETVLKNKEFSLLLFSALTL